MFPCNICVANKRVNRSHALLRQWRNDRVIFLASRGSKILWKRRLPAHPDLLNLPARFGFDEVDMDVAQFHIMPSEFERLRVRWKLFARIEQRERICFMTLPKALQHPLRWEF